MASMASRHQTALLQRSQQRPLRREHGVYGAGPAQRVRFNAKGGTVQEHLAGMVDVRMDAGLSPVGELRAVALTDDFARVIFFAFVVPGQ